MRGRDPKKYLERAAEDKSFVTPGGSVVRVDACDLTVSRLATGAYRCYRCPGRLPNTNGGHWTTHDAGEMLLHAVDHKIAGLRVPDKGLRRLAVDALRPRRG